MSGSQGLSIMEEPANLQGNRVGGCVLRRRARRKEGDCS